VKLLKQSRRQKPKVSLILLDWSVRESFHLLHYLSKQNVDRDLFEVIIIEYYSRVSDALRPFEDQVDTWVLLEVPESCYYHKHLMYNAGIVLSRGEICVICDSDAMVKEGFIGTIISEFERNPDAVLHIDQFRNNRRDFYPFNYPSFEEVLGPGCINNVNGQTRGVLDVDDPIHTRNYGACMCARRSDMIAIGGADEHIDFLGHICGPYDMTFRLVVQGRREIWHQSEFMFHTWHPGQAGVDNYLGPHDGRHVSTTALDALIFRRTAPLLENGAVRLLRTGAQVSDSELLSHIIRPDDAAHWTRDNVERGILHKQSDSASVHVEKYKGFSVHNEEGRFYAHPLLEPDVGRRHPERYRLYVEAPTLGEVRQQIDRKIPPLMHLGIRGSRLFILIWQLSSYAWSRILRPLWRASYIRLPAAVGRRLKTFYKSVRSRFGQFALEERRLADSLSDIIPNLHYLATVNPGVLATGIPLLLVNSKRFAIYLKFMVAARFVPPATIVRIESRAQLLEVLANNAVAESPAPLLLSRGVYITYYMALGGHTCMKNAMII
jgi:hypothetical protein